MPEYNQLVEWPSPQGELFDRPQTLTTTPGVNGWTIEDTSSAGAPTYTVASGGGMTLTLAADSEAEIVTMYHNDVLNFDIDELHTVEFLVKVSGIDSVTTLVFGMGSAQADTADSVATNAWFRMQGSASTSNLLVETDDGTTDLDDKATGTTLSSTWKKCVIDFTNGTSDVRFYVDDARVAASTTFDMDQATGNVQPIVQLQKASGTGTPAVTIGKVKITYAKAFD